MEYIFEHNCGVCNLIFLHLILHQVGYRNLATSFRVWESSRLASSLDWQAVDSLGTSSVRAANRAPKFKDLRPQARMLLRDRSHITSSHFCLF